jgi:outer membrane protein assembly factor BamB|nr:MAG: hypothetical protein KatS3mg041_0760 [Bacteroidota bacterium]
MGFLTRIALVAVLCGLGCAELGPLRIPEEQSESDRVLPSAPNGPLQRRWHRNLGAGFGPWAFPLCTGPYIWLPSRRGALLVLRAGDGRPIGARTFGRALEAVPATDGRYLFVPVAFGGPGLVAYEIATARVRWHFGEASVEVPPLYREGRLWLCTVRGGIRELDPETGALRRGWDPERAVQAATGPVWMGDGILYATLDGTVRAFDLELRLRWERRLSEPISGALAAHQGRIWIGTTRGRVLCLDASTGALRWERRMGPEMNRIVFPPVVLDEGVLVAAWGGSIWLLDAQTGQVRWELHPEGGIGSRIVAALPWIWVATTAGELLGLEPRSGRIRLRLPLPGRPAAGLSRCGDLLFVLGENGDVVAFELFP